MNAKDKKNLYNLGYWFDVVGMILNIGVFLYAMMMMLSTDSDFGIVFGYFLIVISVIKYAWYIPMSLAAKKATINVDTDKEKGHMALGICTLLFCGLVAGVLIMIAASGYMVDHKEKDNQAKKQTKATEKAEKTKEKNRKKLVKEYKKSKQAK